MDKPYLLSSLPSPSSFLHKQCEYMTDYSCIILQDTKHIALSLFLSLPHWLSLSLTHTHTQLRSRKFSSCQPFCHALHTLYITQKFLRKKIYKFFNRGNASISVVWWHNTSHTREFDTATRQSLKQISNFTRQSHIYGNYCRINVHIFLVYANICKTVVINLYSV